MSAVPAVMNHHHHQQQQFLSMFQSMDSTSRKQLLQTLGGGDPRAPTKERRVLAPLPRQSGGSINIARHTGIAPIGHHRQMNPSGFNTDREETIKYVGNRAINASFAADTTAIFSGDFCKYVPFPAAVSSHERESSWPPSPMSMPPMPTFLDDLPQSQSHRNTHAFLVEEKRGPSLMSHPIRFDFSADSAASGGPNIWGADGHRFAPSEQQQQPVKRARTGTSGGAVVPLSSHADHHRHTHARAASFETISTAPVSTSVIDMDARFKELVPSPSALAKLASEHSRSTAATYLSDWLADAIWEASSPLLDVSVSPFRRSLDNLGSASSVPPPFRRFVQQTVYQVSASAGSVLLALYYVHKLPIAAITQTTCEKDLAFRDDLFGVTGAASRSQIPWRLLVLGLTLANKWMEDNTFTTKTWHEVTGLSIASMRSIEMRAIAIFDWALGPRPDAWQQWLQQLRLRETNKLYGFDNSSPVSRRSSIGTIGSERKAGMTSVSTRGALRVIDELIGEVRHTRVSFDPVFPSSCLAGSVVAANANAETPGPQVEEFPTPPPSYSAHQFSSAGDWESQSRLPYRSAFAGKVAQSEVPALGLSLSGNANHGSVMSTDVHVDTAASGFSSALWLRQRSSDSGKQHMSVWPSSMPVF